MFPFRSKPKPPPKPTPLPRDLMEKARRWEEAWGVPGLLDSVTVELSTRFRTSLGLCRPRQGRIRLAADLMEGSDGLLEEVFCHELAHVAVYRLHGRRARPHGPEWKGLLMKAGHEPRVRVREGDPRLPARFSEPRPRWEHRCPSCGARRVAGRPVRQWRCGVCVRAGRRGELVIGRLPVDR